MYVTGNPLKYRDPSGHYEFEDDPDVPYRPPKPPRQKPWWESDPPAIGSIKPGGQYGDGVITWGGQQVSVYLPPQVRLYPSNPGYYPRHYGTSCQYGVDVCMDAWNTIIDYWYGEDYGNSSTGQNHRQDPLVEGSWELVTTSRMTSTPLGGRMSFEEIAGGVAYGRYNEMDTPAPEPSEMGTEAGHRGAVADGLTVVGNALWGARQFVHDDYFSLQRNSTGNYRVIILVIYEWGGEFYRTSTGNHPAGNYLFTVSPVGQ